MAHRRTVVASHGVADRDVDLRAVARVEQVPYTHDAVVRARREHAAPRGAPVDAVEL